MNNQRFSRKVMVSETEGNDPSLVINEAIKFRSHGNSYTDEIQIAVDERDKHKIIEKVQNVEVNKTPKEIPPIFYVEKFRKLFTKIEEEMDKVMAAYSFKSFLTASRARSSARVGNLAGVRQSMEEVIIGVGDDKIKFDGEEPVGPELRKVKKTPYNKPFIRIVLRKSEEFLLYTQSSSTALRGTPEGDEAEKDNKHYEYMTIGKGRVRRRSDAETQTDSVLMKSRETHTKETGYVNASCYVSQCEMHDTLHGLLKSSLHTHSRLAASEGSKDEIENALKHTNRDSKILESIDFQHTKMVLGRAVSGNLHEKAMRRFRNLDSDSRFSKDATYSYSINLLFRCVPSSKERKPVSDISFCPTNGDIFAVAYGIYSYMCHLMPASGDLLVWNIKNPAQPERHFNYKVPVMSVRFSPYLPNLLAVGFFDGFVEVRDITNPKDGPVAISQRSTSPNSSPVVAIRWIKQGGSQKTNEIDPFLALGQDGSVTRYRIIKSPYLLGFNQMMLERVVGHPEGILVPGISPVHWQALRNPQGMNMINHPEVPDIYYVLTDEGCINKCSTNYQHQYLEILKCHDGNVLYMEFSPWSPKLFLTCGNDWCIRIWIEGVLRPLFELRNDLKPVHQASWSPTNSTIIVALNRNCLDIWDIKRSNLKPMATHELDSSHNTMFTFSKCGRTLLIGNERGVLMLQALENFPFPSHFQYDELEKAIFKAVRNDRELVIELKAVGFFGYPKKQSKKSV